jgi:hypothetical protein
VLSVASALLDENEGFVQLPPEGAATVMVVGVVGLMVVVVLLVGVVGWAVAAVVVVVMVLVGVVGLVIAPEAPAFSGAVVVVVFGAPVAVVDGAAVVVVEVAASLCFCALAADVRTVEGDPPIVRPIAIPPPAIVSARAAMPARAAALLRGLIASGLSSVMHGRLLRTVHEKATRECRAPSLRAVSVARCR